jgi:hypothetical protein
MMAKIKAEVETNQEQMMAEMKGEAKTNQERMNIHDDQTEKSVPTAMSRGRRTRQAGTSYCCCSSNWLGSSGSKKRTEKPRYRAHSGGSTEWKDITDHSPTYKCYWNQCKSLAVRIGKLEHH